MAENTPLENPPKRALSFKQVMGRFKMLGVDYMPFRNGGGYFIGADRKKGIFPYATGPVCQVADHAETDIIPALVVENWFRRLSLTSQEVATFWSITDHTEVQPNR